MKLDQKVISRFQELIEIGELIKPITNRTTTSEVMANLGLLVDVEKTNQWGISCLNLLRRVFGKDSDHYSNFNALFPKLSHETPVRKALGIFRGAKKDYEDGYLFDTRLLIQAEVFDDFLEQAEHLFAHGYYQPAAVIAGAVLEDGLRELCKQRGIPLQAKVTIDPMNIALAKNGAYGSLVQKRITALADLRNKAAHGKWSEFSKDDVKKMLAEIRSLMESHFS